MLYTYVNSFVSGECVHPTQLTMKNNVKNIFILDSIAVV